MSSKAGKRPLRSLTAHEKLEAIRRVHDGESKASVARDIGVPESTLRGWCKNEDKISYLSRQSSPDTDESAPGTEPKEKKPKLEDVLLPYNLSMKTNGATTHSPVSEFDAGNSSGNKAPLNLNVTKTTTEVSIKTTERERNRAELARLSVELGLNRPEMFLPNMNSGNSLSDLSSNIGLLAQWNSILMHQHHKVQNNPKVTAAPADTSTNNLGTFSCLPKTDIEHKHYKHNRPPKMEKPSSLDESVWYWLKSQPSMMGLMQNQNGLPPPPASTSAPSVTSTSSVFTGDSTANTDQNSSWFWKWYKQFASSYPLHHQLPDKPILYQQLTKDKDSYNTENIKVEEKPTTPKNNSNNNTKARAVLDNLLFNNNNNLSPNKKDVRDELLSQHEALEHGEKFLEWLECCSEPSVTAVQIMQFRYLLNNIKNGAGKKNSESQNRAKVKRK